jgi:hypothetical protein
MRHPQTKSVNYLSVFLYIKYDSEKSFVKNFANWETTFSKVKIFILASNLLSQKNIAKIVSKWENQQNLNCKNQNTLRFENLQSVESEIYKLHFFQY